MANAKNGNTIAIKATIVEGEGGVLASPNAGVHLEFGNGKTLPVMLGDLPQSIISQCILHGLKQKLVDAAAISRNPDTGRAASIDDKIDAIREVADRLFVGQWNKVREGGTGSGGLLLRALVRMFEGKKTVEAVRAYLETKTPAEQAALRKNSKVAAIIEDIRAESAGADGIDTDDLLAELSDDE